MIVTLLILIGLAIAVPSVGKPLLTICMIPVCIAIDIVLFPFRCVYHLFNWLGSIGK